MAFGHCGFPSPLTCDGDPAAPGNVAQGLEALFAAVTRLEQKMADEPARGTTREPARGGGPEEGGNWLASGQGVPPAGAKRRWGMAALMPHDPFGAECRVFAKVTHGIFRRRRMPPRAGERGPMAKGMGTTTGPALEEESKYEMGEP